MRTGYGTRVALLFAAVLGLAPAVAGAAREYRQVVGGLAVYFGVMPAELVRGHPREHPESAMHGGTPVGESHLVVAVFDAKTGERIAGASVKATVTGADGKLAKPLDPMIVAGSLTYGNYFYLTGPGPYRIDVEIRRPGATKPARARFEWARS